MQEPKQSPENNTPFNSSNINKESKDFSKDYSDKDKNEKNVKDFTEFLEKASNQNLSDEKFSLNSENLKPNQIKSIFKKFLNNGFDGISTNPNYKMLALLVILLINLSLFFVIGNMGKAFLKNAGIMG